MQSSSAFPARGLSPLARGTQRLIEDSGERFRFIPAGAGNTAPVHPQPTQRTVYPRWRGEHENARIRFRGVAGLSPLARGTPVLDIGGIITRRFIPAGAGNTDEIPGGSNQGAVYPRWRGEHVVSAAYRYSSIGLSPLARGTRAAALSGWFMNRFIPAGAGNTLIKFSPSKRHTVYPRWRGEHVRDSRAVSSEIGLSPLARGTRKYCFMGPS